MATYAFTGRIAGLGTTAGTRIVLGHWERSPWGGFADVMLEQPDGHRVLLAPSPAVAEFVAATYTFDEVRTGPVAVGTGPTWTVRAPGLDLAFTVGPRHPLGRLLRTVPGPLRAREWWARACDPVARTALPGVRTHGSAGGGRTEWYAARDVHRVAALTATWDGSDLGSLAAVVPAVRFGFGSSPATPLLTTLTSYVRDPAVARLGT